MKTLALCVLVACAPAWKATPHDQLFQLDTPTTAIRKPPELDPSDWWNKGHLLGARPLGRLISPGTYVKVIAGAPPARDVNRLGQVPDSAWFENRIGRNDYTAIEARDGAAFDRQLAPGPLAVISGKIDGVSAGFVVRDTAAQVWYLKLDHPGFPELSTSAEVISSRLLWLAGYHVPAMQALDLDVSRLVLDPQAQTRDRYNRSVPLTADALRGLLVNANPNLEGRVRALISAQPAGTSIGPFSYRGQRTDDPEDTIAHEHRRSLRGLWLFCAWVNNTDTRDANTLDVFRPTRPDGRGIIEHYLIDFGDAFGSTGLGEKAAMEGWQHLVDWRAMLANLMSLGLRTPPWRKAERSPIRAVGLFEASIFEPSQWRSELPNPAFENRTAQDTFWAASILARIQPFHIRAAVESGRYSEPGAAEYVVDILLKRRAKLLEYAFADDLELDRPRSSGSNLQLDDLRALGNLAPAGPIGYTIRWNRTRRADRVFESGRITSTGPLISLDLSNVLDHHADEIEDDPFLSVDFVRGHKQLTVHLRVTKRRLTPIATVR